MMQDVGGHLVFGEWWGFPRHPFGLGAVSDSSEMLYIELLYALKGPSVEPLLPFSSGLGARCKDGDDICERIICMYESLLGDLKSVASVIGDDPEKYFAAFDSRWAVSGMDVATLVDYVCDRLKEHAVPQTRRLLAAVCGVPYPVSLREWIDLAMYPALPAHIAPQIWVRPPTGAAELPCDWSVRSVVAVCHEVVGHLFQHRLLQGNISRHASLDRELMEGWAIYAEGVLRGLGELEMAAVTLWEAKRLCPLAAEVLGAELAEDFFRRMRLALPTYCSAPELTFFRRTTRRHARGYLRLVTEFEIDRSVNLLQNYLYFNPWR